MKKLSALLLVGVILASVLAVGGSVGGCAKAEAKTLTIWAWDTCDTGLKATIDSFKASHPDVEVNVVTVPWDEIHTKLATALEAGQGAPDLCTVEGYLLPSFAGAGLMDLTEKLAPFKDQVVSAKWGEDTVEGKIYGVPWDLGPALLFYRSDLLSSWGVNQIPATWDEYVATVGPKAKAAGKYLFGLEPSFTNNFYYFRPLLTQIGSGIYGADGKVMLGDEKSKRVLQFMRDLVADGYAMPGVDYFEGPTWWSALKEDKVVSFIGASWMTGMLKDQVPEQSGKWAVTSLPAWDAGGSTTTNLGGCSVVIPEQSKNKDLAFEFIQNALLSKEGNLAIYKATDQFPSFIQALEDPSFGEATDPYFGNAQVAKMFAEAAPGINPFYYTKYEDQANSAINSILTEVLSGQTTVDQGLQKMVQQLNEIAGQ